MGVATITRLREVLHSNDLDVVSLANVSQQLNIQILAPN